MKVDSTVSRPIFKRVIFESGFQPTFDGMGGLGRCALLEVLALEYEKAMEMFNNSGRAERQLVVFLEGFVGGIWIYPMVVENELVKLSKKIKENKKNDRS